MLPLSGFRVLDLTRFLSGPYCTMVLADYGADVIKIEQPGTGDDSRRMAPKTDGESYPFAMANRGKRSVSLDLKSERGRELFTRLIEDADLIIENFRPGVMKKLGFDYDSVREIRDDILYCSISGFGQTGPYRDRPGFDIIAQGVGGFMRMTGHPDGQPAKVGIAINDIAAGVSAVHAILAAQMVREKTGEGQNLDISLVDAGLAWTVWESGAYFGDGELPLPNGTRHRRSTPYQAYRTADGFVTVGANTERLWLRLIDEVLDRPGWKDDPRFATLADRMANIDELEVEIEKITTTQPTESWIDKLDAAGVPGGPVLRFDETLSNEHVLARDMVVDLDHPVLGPIQTIGVPVKYSGFDIAVGAPAPWLGQHTDEVLRETGIAAAELTDLAEQGVTYDARPELHRS